MIIVIIVIIITISFTFLRICCGSCRNSRVTKRSSSLVRCSGSLGTSITPLLFLTQPFSFIRIYSSTPSTLLNPSLPRSCMPLKPLRWYM